METAGRRVPLPQPPPVNRPGEKAADCSSHAKHESDLRRLRVRPVTRFCFIVPAKSIGISNRVDDSILCSQQCPAKENWEKMLA